MVRRRPSWRMRHWNPGGRSPKVAARTGAQPAALGRGDTRPGRFVTGRGRPRPDCGVITLTGEPGVVLRPAGLRPAIDRYENRILLFPAVRPVGRRDRHRPARTGAGHDWVRRHRDHPGELVAVRQRPVLLVERQDLRGQLLRDDDDKGHRFIVVRPVGVEPYVGGGAGVLGYWGERDINMFRSRRPEHRDGVPGPVCEGAGDDELLSPGAPSEAFGDVAFNELFRSLYARVHAYMLRSSSVPDADDVLIETFTTVWLRWKDLPAEEPARTAWVFAVAHNKLREHQRSTRRQAALNLRVVALRDRTPVEPTDRVSALDRTRDLLRRMPPDEADAIALTVFADLSPAQAAEVLGCPRSTVNTRTHRARQHLSQFIAEEVTDDR